MIGMPITAAVASLVLSTAAPVHGQTLKFTTPNPA